MKIRLLAIVCLSFFYFTSCKDQSPQNKDVEVSLSDSTYYKEMYRPQFHFSPEEKWMNDPNGLVYHQGLYHLFYQYYPEDIVWGPMHWGHAVSKDMVLWEHRPIALYPDKHGLIFSGSAVVDVDNSSEFGTKEKPPLVAIYTNHDMDGEQAGRNDFQTQGIAYSLDNGDSFTKFEGNPVIGNEGIRDFRDPKVFWHEESKSWIMALVAGDHAQFYRSDNLKEWNFISDFGKDKGAHGGVWECPDLFPLRVEGIDEYKWVLLISINPGAPNGGSGTQYFIGDFDGTQFTSGQEEARWLDWGTDNYAGVTYNNTPGGDRLFIGWMSNWDYARDTPTKRWRSSMTLPRKLTLQKVNDRYALVNYPIKSLDKLRLEGQTRLISLPSKSMEKIEAEELQQSEIIFNSSSRDFSLAFKNEQKEVLEIVLDSETKKLVLDRRNSGQTNFKDAFGNKLHNMPLSDLPDGEVEFRIVMDWSSIEIFINKGQYVMTAQVFPNTPFNVLELTNTAEKEFHADDFKIFPLRSIWSP